jgi:hypothetical protein
LLKFINASVLINPRDFPLVTKFFAILTAQQESLLAVIASSFCLLNSDFGVGTRFGSGLQLA